MSDEIWKASATELAARIRARQLSCVEVVRAFLGHIESLDRLTNSFAFVDAEGALRSAREADAALARGDAVGTLHGLPVAVKDVIATKGMRTAFGSRLYADNVPAVDPEAIARVRRAGGIIVGKTTTPEFAHKIMTDSPLHGITRNPWALERSCGGSSGGAGVAAAMGFAPLNVTTDGGGSSRVPAACCGVVGLKPTMGAVPNETGQDLFGLQVLGVIARSVGDVRLLFEAMAGPYTGDPMCTGPKPDPITFGVDPVDVLRGLRVRSFPLMGNRAVDTEVATVTRAMVDVMANAGARVFEAGDIDWATDAWRVYMRAQQAHRFRGTLGAVRDRLDPSMVACIEEGLNQGVGELQAAMQERSGLFRRLQTVFAEADILVAPVIAAPPLLATHKAHEPIYINGRNEGALRSAWYNYVVPINGSGHPGMSVPCGYTRGGLPLGLQIIGPWHSEPLLLRVAAAIETLRPWTGDWPPAAA